MSDKEHPLWRRAAQPVIGMVHLAPLPGAPRFAGDLEAVGQRAAQDAQTLRDGGVDALLIENYGDTPFYPRRVPAAVAAHMTAIAARLRERVDLPLGVNVLRNDGLAALAVAHAVGADFIRVNVLCGARVTDQGVIEGAAHELLRERARLGAERIHILADVSVKHSTPLGPEPPIEQEVADLLERGHADGVIVTGSGTGRPIDVEALRRVRAAAGASRVLVGSGVTPGTIRDLAGFAHGFIVGTALKVDGVATNPVDAARVRALVEALRPGQADGAGQR